jgi:hypothetical protein
LAIDEMLELNAAMSSVTRLKQARKPFLVDMKHFSGVLASGHLLDRLLRCINAWPPAMQPSVCQRVHTGEQRGLCREPLVRTAGENISHRVVQRY